jgi:L-asparaginase/Glu-tRNA(Gln) amidotransferase subunit D
MSFKDWARVARAVAANATSPDIRGIVVVHGTSTLEEAAYFLYLTSSR